jgi:hypothetical protein
MVGFLPGLGFPLCENQPSQCMADYLPIRKSKCISVGKEMGFSECAYEDIRWTYCFCFSPVQNGMSDHKFTVVT